MSLHTLEADLLDLQHFKSASALDPEANLKQIAAQTVLYSKFLQDLNRNEREFMSRFDEERRAADDLVLNKVMEIVEAAKNGLSAVLRTKTMITIQENQRFKKEIKLQIVAHGDLCGEIVKLEANNQILVKEKQMVIDERRWKMADRMTCKPDMDVACA